jgi:integral membrane sensor domain MASE1
MNEEFELDIGLIVLQCTLFLASAILLVMEFLSLFTYVYIIFCFLLWSCVSIIVEEEIYFITDKGNIIEGNIKIN